MSSTPSEVDEVLRGVRDSRDAGPKQHARSWIEGVPARLPGPVGSWVRGARWASASCHAIPALWLLIAARCSAGMAALKPERAVSADSTTTPVETPKRDSDSAMQETPYPPIGDAYWFASPSPDLG
jgi:hypothetical protein